MKYYEITFTITPCSQDARDILAALAGEAGCESFEETDQGLRAYIQRQLYEPEAFGRVCEEFPMAGCRIACEACEAEDRDWNEPWEQEGFSPIHIPLPSSASVASLVIHDGRHLPETPQAGIAIEIDARQAFGTGTHETTRMVCRRLASMDLSGRHVLDCGSGTGILGICALKLGAESCTAYDIDEWSADNTRHNAVINRVDHLMDIRCGDSGVLAGQRDRFDLVMANINRNILLRDMPRFRQVMRDGATLLISGFYECDCELLADKARSLGLSLGGEYHDGEWACMALSVPSGGNSPA